MSGHIISHEGIRIDPRTVEAINKIELPWNKVEVQYFLGKGNFLRIFIDAFSEIVKYKTNMLGKDKEINLHMVVELSTEEKNPQGQPGPPVAEHFLSSQWYIDIFFVLQHLQAPLGMEKTRAIFIKQKTSRFCILEGKLHYKEP